MSDLTQYLLAQAARKPLATAQFAIGEAWRRSRMRWSNGIERGLPALSTEGLAARFAPFLPADLSATEYARLFPRGVQQIQERADSICRHELELFGHRFTAGRPIDWHRDHQAGHQWPCAPPNALRVLDAPPGADVKRPWELSRFHHALALGQAFFLTQDENYAREFAAQVLDWAKTNPYPRGIHWAMPMEVGIRVVNLCAAAAFFARAAALNREFWQQFLALIFLHGRFLNLHREWNPVARGNHHLGSLLGLLYAGALFRAEADGHAWFDDAREAIRGEMGPQVGADGVAHEGSSNYHVFVSEMMGAATILAARVEAKTIDEAWGSAFCHRLEAMFDFPAALIEARTAPPILGDSDDGRLLPLCSSGESRGVEDVLAVGRALFGREQAPSGSHGCEQAWWMLGSATKGLCARPAADRPRVAIFADAGFYFFSSGRVRGSVRCGPLGVNGWANHAHCDQLNVEFCLDGAPVLMDPGTYAYSGDPSARNEFRGSRFHNSPVVDGAEQNRFWPGLLFRIVDDTRSSTRHWEETADAVRFAGEHRGYRHLPQGVRVSRELALDRRAHSLLIVDSLTGGGSAAIEWNWQLAPGIEPEQTTTSPHAVCPADVRHRAAGAWIAGPVDVQMWLPQATEAAHTEVVDGWVAPSYGQRLHAKRLRVSCRAQFPIQAAFLFTPRELRGAEKP